MMCASCVWSFSIVKGSPDDSTYVFNYSYWRRHSLWCDHSMLTFSVLFFLLKIDYSFTALIQSNIYDTSFGHLESLSREQDTNISLYIITSNSRPFFPCFHFKIYIFYISTWFLFVGPILLNISFFFSTQSGFQSRHIYLCVTQNDSYIQMYLYINPTKQNPIKNVRDSVESDL